MLGHEPVEPVARLACLRWHKRCDRANYGEYGEGEESLPLRARGQQHRHHQHRAQLTPRAVGNHRVANRRTFESAFLENRHQRAERGRGERDHRGHSGHVMPFEVRHEGNHRERKHKCRRPRRQPHAALMPAQLLGVNLVPGQQKQKRETELAEQLHRFTDLNHPEHMRPQQRPGEQQQHGLRHGFAGNELHDDWAQHRHEHDDSKRDKIDGHTAIIVAMAENRRFAP